MAKKASASVPELADFNAARKKADDLARQLKDAADALRGKGSSAATAKDFKALADAIAKLKQLRQTVPSAAQALRDATDAAHTALDAYIASLADKAGKDAQTAPDALSPLPPGVFPDTIAGSGMKVVNANPGGTTGAQIVEIDGRRYVFKTAGKVSAEHVRNEAAADQAYRRAGIRVPDCRIYEEGGKTYKLSEFIDGGQSLGDYMAKATPAQKKAVIDELKQGYIVDSLFANWDVLGTDQDNVLIDKDGHAWRIDNGSSFGFRAQGSRKKPEEWEKREWPDEWRTLRTSPINRGVFDQLTAHDIFSSKVDLAEAVKDLSPETRKALEKPLEELRQMQSRCADFDRGGFVPSFTDSVLESSYDLSKDGFRERCPARASYENYGSGWSKAGNYATAYSGATAVPSATSFGYDILSAVKSINYHFDSGDYHPSSEKISLALSHKPDLTALAAQGDKNAKTLLGIVEKIDDAAVQKFHVKFDHMPNPSTIPLGYGLAGLYSKKEHSSSYASLTDEIACFMRDHGARFENIPDWQSAQGYDSWNADACKMKYALLLARGKPVSGGAGNADHIYYGWGKVGQKSNWKETLDFFSDKNAGALRKDEWLKSAATYKAAISLYLENTDIPGRDSASKTLLLMRTEQSAILKERGIGARLLETERGSCESSCTEQACYIHGDTPIMSRVPYSRVNGTYLLERIPGSRIAPFLGPGEKEFNADFSEDGGITSYIVGEKYETDMEKMTAKFLECEKKDGLAPR